MRRRGTGTITPCNKGFRVQIWVDGRRRSLGVHPTRTEAEAILAASVLELREGLQRDGVTLEQWGKVVLDRRELQGLRGIAQERSRWASHVVGSELASLPVRSITRADVQRWLDVVLVSRARGVRASARPISRQTASNALTILRAVLEDAVARGIATTNAAREVVLPRSRGRTKETWTFLTPEEQTALMVATPRHAKPMVAFALTTGLRQGEQWALRLEDVHLEDPSPHVVVRFGSKGKPTKSGQPRRVDLLPAAVDAVKAQLAILRTRNSKKRLPPNEHDILFPSRLGEHRQPGAPPGWETWCEAAKLGRTVRWHDLRHTCASSLVAGWWGRAWTLVEVRALLGHSTTAVTERYAHLAGTVTEHAVRATVERSRVLSVSTQSAETTSTKTGLTAWNNWGSHLGDLNPRPTVYELPGAVKDSGDVGGTRAHACAEPELPALAKASVSLARLWDVLEEDLHHLASGDDA